MIAEEVSIQLYLDSPCPNDMPCDKNVGRSQIPAGAFLMIAAAIIYVSGKVILPFKKDAQSATN